MGFQSVLFDLDGTLVDSAPGILSSLEYALHNTAPSLPFCLSADDIGPPLHHMLSLSYPQLNDTDKARIVDYFSPHYDNSGYKKTLPYLGISSLLEQLHSLGFHLGIVTNKRSVPTKKILDHFGWLNYFSVVLCSDIEHTRRINKTENLINALLHPSFSTAHTVYVGDRISDYLSCREVSLAYLHASWGYESVHTKTQHLTCLSEPSQLLPLLTTSTSL